MSRGQKTRRGIVVMLHRAIALFPQAITTHPAAIDSIKEGGAADAKECQQVWVSLLDEGDDVHVS